MFIRHSWLRFSVASLEGSMEIDSAPGRGTKVTVRVEVGKGEGKEEAE